MRNSCTTLFVYYKTARLIPTIWLLLLSSFLTAQPFGCPSKMIFVEGGKFDMGCTPEQHQAMIDDGLLEGCQTNWAKDELPVHEVALRQFYIGKYEVTQGQWASVMPHDTLPFNVGAGSNFPVYQVSWYDAITFCNRLSIKEGFTPCYYSDPSFETVFDSLVGRHKVYLNVYWNTNAEGYRLPLEAEWEYAARGGQKSQQYAYAGSNTLDDVAIYNQNNALSGGNPVGTKQPNELGIYDLSGNEWEWVWDWHMEEYYQDAPPCQPIGPKWSEFKACRGGNWRNRAAYSRVSNRIGIYPGIRTYNIGFRIARGKMQEGHCMGDGT